MAHIDCVIIVFDDEYVVIESILPFESERSWLILNRQFDQIHFSIVSSRSTLFHFHSIPYIARSTQTIKTSNSRCSIDLLTSIYIHITNQKYINEFIKIYLKLRMFHSWRKEEIIECIEFHEKENFLGGKKKKKEKVSRNPKQHFEISWRWERNTGVLKILAGHVSPRGEYQVSGIRPAQLEARNNRVGPGPSWRVSNITRDNETSLR